MASRTFENVLTDPRQWVLISTGLRKHSVGYDIAESDPVLQETLALLCKRVDELDAKHNGKPVMLFSAAVT